MSTQAKLINQLLDKAYALVEARQLTEAKGLFEQVCREDAFHAEAWMMFGAMDAELGNMVDALTELNKAIELDTSLLGANYYLARLYHSQGDVNQALEYVEKAMAIDPDYEEACLLGGVIYAMLGQLENSATAYQNVLKLKHDSAPAYYGLGYIACQQGHFEDAVVHYGRVLEISPGQADVANNLGTVYQAIGKFNEAIDAFDRALAIKPDYAEALFGKAQAFVDLSRLHEAVPIFQQAISIRPDYSDACLNLAAVLMSFEQQEQALEYCHKVLSMQPDSDEAIAMIARIELQSGQTQQAYQRLKTKIDVGVQNTTLTVSYGEVCRSLNRPEEAIDFVESQLNSPALAVTKRRNLYFCLGGLYDKAGDYDRAFANYKAGNDLRAIEWEPQSFQAYVDTIIKVFSKALLRAAPCATMPSQKPIFVLGMPRSGTSLVEQIIASHPAVFGAGELSLLSHMTHDLPEFIGAGRHFPYGATDLDQNAVNRLSQHYLSQLDDLAPDAQRVVDKMPGNFSLLGLIDLLFPQAHVIRCMRDPLDTCLSCYFQDFAMSQPYSFNLAHLGMFYKDYERLMSHWDHTLSVPLLDVSYEELINEQEAVSRRIVEFCGLGWDERCLQFHETKRYVATSSYDQVRQPIYRSSLNRWENYKEHLGPLLEALQ